MDLLLVLMSLVVMVRGGKRRRGKYEQAAENEEEELFHGDQNGTKVERLSLVFRQRIKEAMQRKGYCRDKGRRLGHRIAERVELGA